MQEIHTVNRSTPNMVLTITRRHFGARFNNSIGSNRRCMQYFPFNYYLFWRLRLSSSCVLPAVIILRGGSAPQAVDNKRHAKLFHSSFTYLHPLQVNQRITLAYGRVHQADRQTIDRRRYTRYCVSFVKSPINNIKYKQALILSSSHPRVRRVLYCFNHISVCHEANIRAG